jgi:LmbE family N-acetylglucosaminyl deacetylase
MPQSTVRNIFAMEVASSTEWATPHAATAFVPTRYVDISSTIDVKRRAIEVFAEEMRPFPHPRSIEAITALATWRGASAGLTAAEAFMVVREVVT